MGDAWYELDGLTVEAAFGYEPLDPSPVWTDITAYVRDLTVRRGRNDEYSQYAPGVATVVLDNRGRRFDPEHAASPYDGDLLPMVPLRIVADHDTVDYPMFYGFVQGWPQSIGKGYTDSTVTVTVVDAFRILTQRRLAESAYAARIVADGPIVYWPLRESSAPYRDVVAGLEMSPQVAGGGISTTSKTNDSPVIGDTAGLQEDYDAASTSGVNLEWPTIGTAPRSLECWMRGTPDVIVRNGINDYVGVSDDLRLHVSNTALNVSNAGGATNVGTSAGWRHVVVTMDATTARLYIDGHQAGATLAVGAPASFSGLVSELGASVSVENAVAHVSAWAGTLSAADVLAHYDAGRFAFGGDFVERTGTRIGRVLDEIGWPATRTLSDGDSALAAYLPNRSNALQYLRELEQVEQGTVFVGKDGDVVFRDRSWHIGQASAVTFADEYGTGLPFRDVSPDGNTVDAIRNTVTVSWSGQPVVASDTASVDAYGPGQATVTSQAIRTEFDATDLARWIIRLGKDPRTRITRLTILPRRAPDDIYPELLDLDLGSVVTVSVRPLGVGASTDYVLAVQGYQHRVSRREWVTDLYLAPAVASSGPYWKLGDATLGVLGVAAGNRIHY